MENFDNNLAWIIAAAILFGIIIGGQIVLSIVRGIGRLMRPNYPPSREYPPHHPEYRSESGGSSCLPVIFLIAVAFIVIKSAFNTSAIQGLFAKPESGHTDGVSNVFKDSNEDSITVEEVTGPNLPGGREFIDSSYVEPAAEEQMPDMDDPDADPHIIQVGAFLEWSYAEVLMQNFAMQGLQVGYTADENEEGKTLYRVYLGEFSSIAHAYRVKQEYKLDQAIIIRAEGVELNYFE